MKRSAGLPAVPAPFPPAFTQLLGQLLARPVAVGSTRDDSQRARASVLSQSGTFVGHRPYVRGDDLRRLDWAAYARTGVLFTKQLEEEDRRTATLLLDLSPSLLAGDPPRRLAMLRAAAVLGGMALARLDGLTVMAPGAGDATVRPFVGVQSLAALLRHLEALPIAAATPSDAIELVLQRQVPGHVHWLSDFAVPAEVERPLHALRRRGARVVGWLPELPSDREAPARGYLRLVDPETGAELLAPVDGVLAAELRAQLKALASAQNRLFGQAGARLVRWPASSCTELRTAAWLPFLARLAR